MSPNVLDACTEAEYKYPLVKGEVKLIETFSWYHGTNYVHNKKILSDLKRIQWTGTRFGYSLIPQKHD